MVANGGRNVSFEIFLGLVLGVLVKLISHVLMYRLRALAGWNEIVAVHPHLQRSLIAIERRSPTVFGIGVWRIAPCPVLPDYLKIAEIPGTDLRISDIGLT